VRLVQSLVSLTLLAVPGLARADDGSPPAKPASESVEDRAARWLSAGNKAFREGRFAEAERAYLEAFAVKKGYDIAGNLGAAELAQGKLREGAQHLALTLRLFPITGEPALRERMQRAFDQCRSGVGAVRIEASVTGAEVLVDGVTYGEAPLLDEVFVDPGEHVFEARAAGYTAATERVTVERGGAVVVKLPLARLPPKMVVVPPPPVHRRSVAPGIVLSAVSLVGFAGGAAFIGVSLGKRADARAQGALILGRGGSCVAGAGNYDAARCTPLLDTARADDVFHDVAVGAFVAGSAAAVASAAYFLWPRLAPSGEKIRVTPVVGAEGGGAVLGGSF
jgi:hypothetical protein